MSKEAPEVPSKDTILQASSDLNQQRDPPPEWRNSLLAIDDDTGQVIGILAHEIDLSSDTFQPRITPASQDSSTCVTKRAFLEYTAAEIYVDLDTMQTSRPNSILGEDTFAPPPIPSKPMQLYSVPSTAECEAHAVHIEEQMIDGRIEVAVSHVETHRPELLCDRGEVCSTNVHLQEASGSNIGGPIVRLWRKAKKSTQRKEMHPVQGVEQQTEAVCASSTNNDSPSCLPLESNQTMMRSATEEMQQHDIDEENMPYLLDSRESIMSRHLPGHSVLLNFLADSHINATIMRSVKTNMIGKVSDERSTPINQVVQAPGTASYDTHGIVSYMPVVPGHLLSYFGLSTNEIRESPSEIQQASSASTSYPGNFLLRFSEALSSSNLIAAGANSATAVWSGFSMLANQITAWIGSSEIPSLPASISFFPAIDTNRTDTDTDTNTDTDIEEWVWAIPTYDPKSLDATPRPIYRRRKILPSLGGRFNDRSKAETGESASSSRCTVVHCDQWGIARRAFTKM